MKSTQEIQETYKGTKKEALIFSLGSTGLFLAAFLIGHAIGHIDFLTAVAISPMRTESLYSIFTYALGHMNMLHLSMNMSMLGFLAFYITRTRGWREYVGLFLVSLVVSGVFTWLTAPKEALVIGASGITAGLAVYLFIRSGLNKDLYTFAISGVFVAITVVGVISAISAADNRMSWHAHVGGLLAGIITAGVMVLRERNERLVHSRLSG